MNFSETIQWVDVIKPFNTDYNVAEKTELVFLEAHGFIVGDYLTENSSGATGIVYEVPSDNRLHLARQDTTEFPFMGTVTNGTTASTYTEKYTEHGINNQVIQDLVDRTAYNKKEIEDVETEVGSIQDNIDTIEGDITSLGQQMSYVLTTSSMTLEKNRTTIAHINGSYDITLTMPNDVQNGDWIKISHGGTSPYNGSVIVYAGGSQILGHGTSMVIDVLYQFVTLGYTSGSWHVIY